jgi:hypothetical protein
MSYDVSLEADTGGEPVEVWTRNHTSNTADMWRDAGLDLRAYEGARASTLRSAAHDACMAILQDVEKYQAMEPDNGWGTVESTVSFLTDISNACAKYPATTVRICY